MTHRSIPWDGANACPNMMALRLMVVKSAFVQVLARGESYGPDEVSPPSDWRMPARLGAVGPTMFGVPCTMDTLVRRHPVHNHARSSTQANLTQLERISAHNRANSNRGRHGLAGLREHNVLRNQPCRSKQTI